MPVFHKVRWVKSIIVLSIDSLVLLAGHMHFDEMEITQHVIDVRYGGVMWFIFHVLQLLLIRLHIKTRVALANLQ
jgi:hypothetical protein